jgi:hypothetical protein
LGGSWYVGSKLSSLHSPTWSCRNPPGIPGIQKDPEGMVIPGRIPGQLVGRIPYASSRISVGMNQDLDMTLNLSNYVIK